jgi:hypothetical protein
MSTERTEDAISARLSQTELLIGSPMLFGCLSNDDYLVDDSRWNQPSGLLKFVIPNKLLVIFSDSIHMRHGG